MKFLFFAAILQFFIAFALAATCSVEIQTKEGAQTIEGQSGECVSLPTGPKPSAIQAVGGAPVRVSVYKNNKCSGPPFFSRAAPIYTPGKNDFFGVKLEC